MLPREGPPCLGRGGRLYFLLTGDTTFPSSQEPDQTAKPNVPLNDAITN